MLVTVTLGRRYPAVHLKILYSKIHGSFIYCMLYFHYFVRSIINPLRFPSLFVSLDFGDQFSKTTSTGRSPLDTLGCYLGFRQRDRRRFPSEERTTEWRLPSTPKRLAQNLRAEWIGYSHPVLAMNCCDPKRTSVVGSLFSFLFWCSDPAAVVSSNGIPFVVEAHVGHQRPPRTFSARVRQTSEWIAT